MTHVELSRGLVVNFGPLAEQSLWHVQRLASGASGTWSAFPADLNRQGVAVDLEGFRLPDLDEILLMDGRQDFGADNVEASPPRLPLSTPSLQQQGCWRWGFQVECPEALQECLFDRLVSHLQLW